MGTTDKPAVLVVEDEEDIAETYEMWLSTEYEVQLAEDGETALDVLDRDVDIVLLDRMMPGMSGDEVLTEIRDRGLDVQVAMVTAVDPDFDIIEMGFDDYLTKPPTRETLHEVVEELLAREQLADTVQEYQSLLAKRAAIETGKDDKVLEDSDAYTDLQEQIEAVKAELEGEEDRFLDDAEFVGALREFDDEEGVGDE